MSAPRNSIEPPAAAPARPEASAASAGRAAGDVVGQIIARVLNASLGVGVTIVLVRGLGPRGYGDWSALLAVISIVGYLTSLGLEDVAVRHAAVDPSRESSWISALMSVELMLSVPVTVVALGVTVAISRNDASRVAAILLSLTCLLSGLSAARTVFQLRIRNSWTAGFELANGVLWAIGVFAVAAAGGGLVNVAQVVPARRQMPFRLRGEGRARRELIRIGIPFAIASLLYLSYTQIDQVLVFEIA